MSKQQTELTIAGESFEGLKKTNQHGAEFWSARDLQPRLGYSQWRRFEQSIQRAITSCKESGNPPEHHFASVGKMIEKEVAKRVKSATPKLELDEHEAGGLLGDAATPKNDA